MSGRGTPGVEFHGRGSKAGLLLRTRSGNHNVSILSFGIYVSFKHRPFERDRRTKSPLDEFGRAGKIDLQGGKREAVNLNAMAGGSFASPASSPIQKRRSGTPSQSPST